MSRSQKQKSQHYDYPQIDCFGFVVLQLSAAIHTNQLSHCTRSFDLLPQATSTFLFCLVCPLAPSLVCLLND